MKKFKFLLICLLIILLTGCSDDLEDVESNIKYTKVEDFVCPDLCSPVKETYIGTGDYFVMKDYQDIYYVYQYNYPLLFDNDMNCKSLGTTDKPVIGFDIDSYHNTYNIIYDDFSYNILDQGLYQREYVYTNSFISNIKNNYNYKYIYDKHFIQPTYESSTMVITDNAIYKGISDKNPVNFFETETSEKILKIFQNAIITTESVYIYTITEPNCKKYISGQCHYGFVKNDELTRIKSNIAFINSKYIILKDGRIYEYQID